MSAAVQCRGVFLPLVQLRGGWPEDDTGCPPLSTAAVWLALQPDSDRETEMRAAMTSQNSCSTQYGSVGSRMRETVYIPAAHHD